MVQQIKASVVQPQTETMVVVSNLADWQAVANASGFFWTENKQIQGAPSHQFFRCIYQGVLWQFDQVQ